jgi:hypothetical protein
VEKAEKKTHDFEERIETAQYKQQKENAFFKNV